MENLERKNLAVVGVLGSGSNPCQERAEQLGAWLAQQGVHLLTGGGGGVMASVSRAFARTPRRRGLVIGIIPGIVSEQGYEPTPGYPNPFVEIPIQTHLPFSGEQGMAPLSRNHINILSSRVLVALPGGAGTAAEIGLALRYGRPLIAYLRNRDEIPGLPRQTVVAPALSTIQRFVLSHLDANR